MIGAIIQARAGSTRFPKKIFEDIEGTSCLERVCHGVAKSNLLHRVVLAMPREDEEVLQREVLGGELFTNPPLRQMEEVVERLRVDAVYFGDEKNVLSRYYEASKHYGLDTIVRITADCPLIRADVIDCMLKNYLKRPHLHDVVVQNIAHDSPEEIRHISGFDVQIFKWWMLADAYSKANKNEELEHVTPYMFEKFGVYNVTEVFHMEDMVDFKGYTHLSFDSKKDLNNIIGYIKSGA